jgi:hypothetical protein
MTSIYNAAEYPQGVPNPFVRNVQEYPSQQHGGDWTRPMFSMPWIDRPYNVEGPPGNVYGGAPVRGLGMNYGREVLLGSERNRRRFTGGMATPDIATRGGIFGAQGYGGGIFDGSLGQADETSTGTRHEEFPWGVSSSETRELQGYINEILKAEGYCPIEQDGELGPATCGAIAEIATFEGEISVPPSCNGHQMRRPGKPPCGSPKPLEPFVAPRRASAAAGGSKMMFVGGAVLAVGLGAFFLTKKRRRK